MPEPARRSARSAGRDAAFATELLAGTCRGQGTYDLSSPRRPVARQLLQPAVLDLLRLGTHQLLAMRVPAHAAVAATVDLAAATVGRAGHRAGERGAAPGRRPDLDGWVDRLTDGLDGATGSRSQPPTRAGSSTRSPTCCRPTSSRPRCADNAHPGHPGRPPGLAEVSELMAAGAEPGRYSPFAARWSGNPADLAAVREGRAGVQDEGSQLVTGARPRGRPPVPWWICAPGRAARPPCWPGWPPANPFSRPTSATPGGAGAPGRSDLS